MGEGKGKTTLLGTFPIARYRAIIKPNSSCAREPAGNSLARVSSPNLQRKKKKDKNRKTNRDYRNRSFQAQCEIRSNQNFLTSSLERKKNYNIMNRSF